MAKLKIRSKIILLVMTITIVSMSIFLIVSQVSVKQEQNNSIKAIELLKVEAANESEKNLKEQAEIYLKRLVISQADNSNYVFKTIETQINMAHDIARELWINPNSKAGLEKNYKKLSKTVENLNLDFYYTLAPKVKEEKLENELKQLSNLSTIFKAIVENNKKMKILPLDVDGVYLGTETGIFYNMTWLAYYNEKYDARERPWYKEAKNKKEIGWSDVYIDDASDAFTITCSKPCYTENDKLKGVIGIDLTLNAMVNIIATQVSDIGEALLINREGEIITYSKLSPELKGILGSETNIFKSKNEKIKEIGNYMKNNEIGIKEISIDSTSKLIAFAPIESTDWKLVFLASTDNIMKYVNQTKEKIDKTGDTLKKYSQKSFKRTLYRILIIFFWIILFSILFLLKFSEKLTKPLCLLTKKVEEIGNGDLNTKIDIKTGDEIEILGNAFYKMMADLKLYIKDLKETTAVKERMESELQIAHKIQASMLPRIFPPFPTRKEFDIYGTMDPAKDVGGDFFDFYLINDNKFCFTIADVSGKGIPAALFMVIAKTIIKNESLLNESLDDVFYKSNNGLCEENDEYLFVTTFTNTIDVRTGELNFVNAGHNPPLLYREETGKYEYLEINKGFVLGGMNDFVFKNEKLKMEKGDILFLYTDGVTEAMNINNDQYSEPRLLNILNNLDTKDIVEIEKVVKKDIKEFTKGAEPSDDITMLIFKYNGENV